MIKRLPVLTLGRCATSILQRGVESWLKSIPAKVFTMDQIWEKLPKMHSNQLIDVLRFIVFKLLRFKVNNFPLTSELLFCQYCDRKLTFGKLTRKAANLQF